MNDWLHYHMIESFAFDSFEFTARIFFTQWQFGQFDSFIWTTIIHVACECSSCGLHRYIKLFPLLIVDHMYFTVCLLVYRIPKRTHYNNNKNDPSQSHSMKSWHIRQITYFYYYFVQFRYSVRKQIGTDLLLLCFVFSFLSKTMASHLQW